LPGASAAAGAAGGIPQPILLGAIAQATAGVVTIDLHGGGSSGWTRPDLPHADRDIKPAKPFQPIWDKVRQKQLEAAEAAQRPPAAAPPVLPPAELFGALPAPGAASLLPSFDHLAPADPTGFAARMQESQDISDAAAVVHALHARTVSEAQDMADALAVLKAIGLIREG
jgi:hypothetical protein